MVFCNLVEKTDRTVTYAYGATPEDITGKFTFDFKEKSLNIIETPKTEDAPTRHIHRMLRANQKEFEAGRFKEKMSYETA